MSDVVDLLEDSPPPAAPAPPTDDQLRQAIKGHLMGKDLSTISLKALRLDLEKGFRLRSGGLDDRKAEIRQLAQDLVIEAQNAPAPPPPMAAPATPVEPAAKKRRTLAQAIPGPAGEAAPGSPVKTKGPKRKAPPSAYSLWSLEHRSTVAEDLEKELQRKPTFGEISKAVPERWKAVSQAERATYEEKAKVAKAEQAAGVDVVKAKPQKAPAEGSRKGKGKGKGKSKDGEDVMSRAEFFAGSPVINCAFQIPGVQASESCMENLVARMFKSQGVGWFSSTKFQVPVGSKEVTVQAQVVMNVSGSKYWEDGEGLEEVMKSLEHRESRELEAAQMPGSSVEAALAPTVCEEAEKAEVQAPHEDCAADPEHTAVCHQEPQEADRDETGAEKSEDVKMDAPENALPQASEVENPEPMAEPAKSEEDAKMEDAAETVAASKEEAMETSNDDEVAQTAEAEAEVTAGIEDPLKSEAADPEEEPADPTDADPNLEDKAGAGGA